jgi:uncharacterized protein YxeA
MKATIILIALIVVLFGAFISLAIINETDDMSPLVNGVYIIDVVEKTSALDSQRWMVHYSIRGQVQTAFFSCFEQANNYIIWLQKLDGGF